MMIRSSVTLLVLAASALAGGCTSISSNYVGDITKVDASRIHVCHGYNCIYKTRLSLGPADAERFGQIMRQGAATPEAERAAISRAVQHFETRAFQAIGIRDRAKSTLLDSGEKGQMDCIDESTNTRSLLLYLAHLGLLKHHQVGANVSRGFLLDGRYFHSTAVIRDSAGKRWAVDSWYEPMGGPPDIMPLEEWMSRGVAGAR